MMLLLAGHGKWYAVKKCMEIISKEWMDAWRLYQRKFSTRNFEKYVSAGGSWDRGWMNSISEVPEIFVVQIAHFDWLLGRKSYFCWMSFFMPFLSKRKCSQEWTKRHVNLVLHKKIPSGASHRRGYIWTSFEGLRGIGLRGIATLTKSSWDENHLNGSLFTYTLKIRQWLFVPCAKIPVPWIAHFCQRGLLSLERRNSPARKWVNPPFPDRLVYHWIRGKVFFKKRHGDLCHQKNRCFSPGRWFQKVNDSHRVLGHVS